MEDTTQPRNLQYAQKLAKLIRIETVSDIDNKEPEKFRIFHRVLTEMFPKIFSTVEVEDFEGSLLLRWRGRDPNRNPVLLMSHHDVVEASGNWSHEPFGGIIADGKLWGRGTLDTKGNLWAILTAAEELADEGFVPEGDIYFESACTEETDGSGADIISQELHRRDITFDFTLDEGGMILYDPIGGADGKFAVVGVGEKGCADLRFVARSKGGHAASPGKDTPLVRLGRFMDAADKSKVFDVQLNDVTAEMLRRMGPYMKGALKVAFTHVNLFKPLLRTLMPKVSNTAGAMLKTTLAFTMAGGSDGTNVLPQEAWVIGNMRFSHHQGGEASIAAIRELASKYDIETIVLDPGFESPLSDYKTPQFQLVEEAVKTVFPDTDTIPYVMTAASDSRYFGRVSENCFRFAPFFVSEEQLDSIHGIDENVDISTLAQAVDFHKFMIRESFRREVSHE